MTVFALAWRLLLAFCLVFNGVGDAFAAVGAGMASPAHAAMLAGAPAAAMPPCHGDPAMLAMAHPSPVKHHAGDDCCGGQQCHCAGAHFSLLPVVFAPLNLPLPVATPMLAMSEGVAAAPQPLLLRPPIA